MSWASVKFIKINQSTAIQFNRWAVNLCKLRENLGQISSNHCRQQPDQPVLWFSTTVLNLLSCNKETNQGKAVCTVTQRSKAIVGLKPCGNMLWTEEKEIQHFLFPSWCLFPQDKNLSLTNIRVMNIKKMLQNKKVIWSLCYNFLLITWSMHQIKNRI